MVTGTAGRGRTHTIPRKLEHCRRSARRVDETPRIPGVVRRAYDVADRATSWAGSPRGLYGHQDDEDRATASIRKPAVAMTDPSIRTMTSAMDCPQSLAKATTSGLPATRRPVSSGSRLRPATRLAPIKASIPPISSSCLGTRARSTSKDSMSKVTRCGCSGRKRVKDGHNSAGAQGALAKVEVSQRRRVLARLSIRTLLDPGSSRSGQQQRPAVLGLGQGNAGVLDLLADDPNLEGFIRPSAGTVSRPIPGKDKGIDFEGLEVMGDRVFIGLRGPVLRRWAVIVELKVGDGPVLEPRPIGPGGAATASTSSICGAWCAGSVPSRRRSVVPHVSDD
jgi:hypothetical protein